MSKVIEKVTAFITRETEYGCQLLLFEHPFAGIQIPAGTVEPSESPEKAVIRGSDTSVVRFLETKKTIIKTNRTTYLTNLAFRIGSTSTTGLNRRGII